MFRRRTSQEIPGFDAGTGINVAAEPASSPKQQQDAQQQIHDAVAAFRQDRRISGDRLAGSTTNASVPGQRATARARVQQAPGSPLVPLQLAPLQLLQTPSLHTQPGAVQGFSVFSNPLSSPNHSTMQVAAAAAAPAAEPAAARQPAALQQHLPTTPTVVQGEQQAAHTAAPVSPRQQQFAAEQQQPQASQPSAAPATTADTGSPTATRTSQAAPSHKDAAVTPKDHPIKHSSLLASKALRFEVSAAGDSDGNDQQLLDAEHMQSDDGLQQQYFYNEMVNRAFFTLISLSLVSASSKLAYDKLGSFKPEHLRLRLVDSLVIALYLLAYLFNLILTPTDDQLTYEARRDLTYYMLPLPSAFLRKVTMWHALNLLRIICCGLAWALVCYRANPYVMMLEFEARKQQEAAGAAVGPSIGRSSAGRTQAGAAGRPDDLARQQHQGYINRLLAAEGSNLSSTGVHQQHRLSDNLSNGLGGSAAALGSDGGATYGALGGPQYNSTGFVGRGITSRLGAPVGSIPRDGSTHVNQLPSVS